MTAAPPVAPTDTTAFALQTPWLERTGWDRTYNNKDRREVLTALTRTFTPPGGREHHIGHGQQYGLDEDLVSPGDDEDRIACLIRLFLDAIWTHEAFRDLATLEELAGKYKRSAGHTQAATGLGERSQTTKEDIGDNYKKEEEDEDEEEESEEDEIEDEENEEEDDDDDPNNNNDKNHNREGQRGDNHQEEDRGFTAWLNNLGEITNEEEYGMEVKGGTAPGSPEELIKLLFGPTLALATQPVVNSQPQWTVLIYFSGILGFSS
ncbi:hypothetical protein LZL87_014027 [Fusarium oxysporum]|nr:hypothetical protein LZL87_014027 [Fusarium oxysporum]